MASIGYGINLFIFGVDRLIHGINLLINSIIPLINGWATGRGPGAAAKGGGGLGGWAKLWETASQSSHMPLFLVHQGQMSTAQEPLLGAGEWAAVSQSKMWLGGGGGGFVMNCFYPAPFQHWWNSARQFFSHMRFQKTISPSFSADEAIHAKLRTHRTFN